MRWQALFADLEGQFAAAEAAEFAAEVRDRTRREMGRLRLVDRLRAHEQAAVTVTVAELGTLPGVVASVGADWLLLEEPGGHEVVIPIAAVTGVSGLTPRSAEPGSEGPVGARLGLGYPLRALVRDRARVVLTLRDATTVAGTLDAVGADFTEIAEHPLDERRRVAAVRAVRAVPFSALLIVRSSP